MTAPTTDRSTVTEDTGVADPTKLAHLVAGGIDLVMRARVMGFPVNALCGHIFIPQQNPDDFPVCQRCSEINDGVGSGTDTVRAT